MNTNIVKAPNIRTKKSAFTIQLRRYKCLIINRLSYKIKYFFLSFGAAIFFFFFFGIPTAIIQTPLFKRMAPPTMYEWVILSTTALLAGAYVGLYYYKKEQQSAKAVCAAATGSIFGTLSFGCAFCNKLLVLVLGISGVMTYFLPIQPYLGVFSVGLLGYGIYTLKKH